MKFGFLLAVLLLSRLASAEAWTPPKDPDPMQILQEVDVDTQAKRYEESLAKLEWFYEHALEYQPSLTGVRLSFALSNWGKLGQSYPPALVKLREVRDAAKQRITPEEGRKIAFEDFQEFTSINRELGDEEQTVDAFRAIDATDTDAAQRVFALAEPALIRAKDYELCGKYIDADESLEQILNSYKMAEKLAKNPKIGDSYIKYANKKFLNDSATLVALLVVNDRTAEAEEVMHELKKVEGDGKLHAKLTKELDTAIQGVVPKPWP
ncbi:hypothetical protein [Lacipirellula parvula]|uniref:Uncharacterized protein n=1 Tax=Lacipirellula parvula TaxID=2650471 RepID=A0A5K7XGZ1_9BACT|nr:hypothetical protein [Lacipirellula parvula]BBO33556.1 hypothetical protein PLANPX_3168 [Lacipirellula parvula]